MGDKHPQAQAGSAVDITIGIPCYNEEARIIGALEHNIEAIARTGKTFEIVVIDDGSKDRSVELVEKFCREHPEYAIVLKRNDRNRGLAFNFVEAALIGTGYFYRMSCGDDPQPVEALHAVYRNLGAADMLVPYMTSCGDRGWKRELLSRSYTAIVNFISGNRIRYYNGSPVYIRKHVLRWHPSCYGFGYSADMVTRLLEYEGASFMQVATWSVEKKGKGSTSMSMRNLLSVTHSILEIAIRRVRRLLYGRDAPAPVEVPCPQEIPGGVPPAAAPVPRS